jgi:hypothetical protein
MVTEQVERVLAVFADAVGGLLDVSLDGLGAVEFARVLERVEVQRRRLGAVDQRLLATADRAGLASAHGQAGLGSVLVSLLRVDPREARARVGRAGDLGPRLSLTGEPLGPVLPATAEAVRDGSVSGGQAQVILDCLEALPDTVAVEASGLAERVLLAAAAHEHPRALRRTAGEVLARLDPDGVEPREERVERARGFSLHHRADGSARPHGRWTAELTALWGTILDALAVPQPGTDGVPDDRSAAQRRHDALVEAARRLLDTGSLTPGAGMPVTVLAITTIGELRAGVGLARLGTGATISISRLLAMAGDAAVLPVFLNDAGGVLAYGRTRRLASSGQRLALAARDRGCSFPGCDRPAAWSEVHHIREWLRDDGPTDLDNLTLVCRYHHRHFASHGWSVRMNPTDHVPEWSPPPWLDPEQKPRRNRTRHRDIDFRQPGEAA